MVASDHGFRSEEALDSGWEPLLEVRLSLGPIERRERDAVLQAMDRLVQGAPWSRIQREMLASQASSRALLITHRLLAAAARNRGGTARATEGGRLELEFTATGITAIRDLSGTLRMLRTPFTMTVGPEDRDTSRLRASWDLGWDEPTVLVLDQPPQDQTARGRLWERLEELLAG